MSESLLDKVNTIKAVVEDAGKFILVSPEHCLEICTSPAYKLARMFYLKNHEEKVTSDLFEDLESAAYDALNS